MSSKDSIDALLNGISIDDYTIYAHKKSSTRFVEESDLELYIKKGTDEAFLLQAKVFPGRKPNYLPWTELFNINFQPKIGNEALFFFNSNFEDRLLDFFSGFPDDAGDLFVEYNSDTETAAGLRAGYPAATTRLGFKLYQRGFTWFKDWYFPEGHMEGGQKLQAEKSADAESQKRQLDQLRDEIRKFQEKHRSSKTNEKFLSNAIEHADQILHGWD